MNQFEKARENGLSLNQESKLNIIRGCILGSFLDNPKKKELCDFLQELEEYFEVEE